MKKIDLGLDISTSCIGAVAIDSDTGEFEKMFAVRLTSTKLKNFYDKVDYAVEELISNIDKKKYCVKNVFVEEAAKRFTPGFSSAGTLFLLARFNGIISNEMRKAYNCEPKMINVRSARKVLGIKINHKDKSTTTKEKVMTAVMGILHNVEFPRHVAKTGKRKGQTVFDKQCEDLCDAWVIAAGGRRISSLSTYKNDKK